MPAKKKILVIEDDASIQLLLRAALEKAGFQAIAALDALQGVQMARQTQPDLIVLDFMMPAGGGSAVFERVRMLNTTFHIPIVIYSTTPKLEIEAAIPALSTLSDVSFVSKSAPLPELIAAIKTFLPAE